VDKIKSIIRKPAAVCIVAAVIILLAVAVPEITAARIDDAEGYGDIFTDVKKIFFYHNDNNFFTTLAPAKKLRVIKRVKIKSEPVSEDRSTDRDSEYRIIIEDNSENKFVLSVSGDFTEMWIDDNDTYKISLAAGEMKVDEGRAASFTYSVRNPKVLKSLFPEDE